MMVQFNCIMGIIDAIPQIIDALLDALPTIIKAIVNGLINWNKCNYTREQSNC